MTVKKFVKLLQNILESVVYYDTEKTLILAADASPVGSWSYAISHYRW